jgi:hypothetical protein
MRPVCRAGYEASANRIRHQVGDNSQAVLIRAQDPFVVTGLPELQASRLLKCVTGQLLGQSHEADQVGSVPLRSDQEMKVIGHETVRRYFNISPISRLQKIREGQVNGSRAIKDSAAMVRAGRHKIGAWPLVGDARQT